MFKRKKKIRRFVLKHQNHGSYSSGQFEEVLEADKQEVLMNFVIHFHKKEQGNFLIFDRELGENVLGFL